MPSCKASSDCFVQPSLGTSALRVAETGNFYLSSKLHFTSTDWQILRGTEAAVCSLTDRHHTFLQMSFTLISSTYVRRTSRAFVTAELTVWRKLTFALSSNYCRDTCTVFRNTVGSAQIHPPHPPTHTTSIPVGCTSLQSRILNQSNSICFS